MSLQSSHGCSACMQLCAILAMLPMPMPHFASVTSVPHHTWWTRMPPGGVLGWLFCLRALRCKSANCSGTGHCRQCFHWCDLADRTIASDSGPGCTQSTCPCPCRCTQQGCPWQLWPVHWVDRSRSARHGQMEWMTG